MFLPDTGRWILMVLALFRLTWTVLYDDGPFDVFVRIRTALGVYDKQENGQPPKGIASFLNCAYCVSRFLVLPVMPLILWPTLIGDLFLTWYGLSGALAILIRWRPWNNY